MTIGSSVTSISVYSFRGCTGLTRIMVDAANSVYDSRDNCNAIIKSDTNELIYGCKTTRISNSVTNIGEYAFFGCTGLTSVTIPDSVTKIGDMAFSKCESLNNIVIPDSVTRIGTCAFFSC